MTGLVDYCEDCALPSDLGKKCRTCYAKWSRRLWADIPRWLKELREIAVALNKTPQSQRKAIATTALGGEPDVVIAGKAAELLAAVKRAQEGPYGEQLNASLQAIQNAGEEKGRKASASEVD